MNDSIYKNSNDVHTDISKAMTTIGASSENNDIPDFKYPIKTPFLLFSPFCMVMCYILVNLIFDNPLSAFTSLILSMIATASVMVLKFTGYSIGKKSYGYLGLVLIFAFAFSYTDNSFILFFVGIFELILYPLMLCSVTHPFNYEDHILPFYMIKNLNSYISDNSYLFSIFKELKLLGIAGKNVLYSLYGLLLCIPVTIVIGALLMSADDGTRKILSSLFSFGDTDYMIVILRLVFSLIIACSLFGAVISHNRVNFFTKKDEETADTFLEKNKSIPSALLFTACIPSALLYGIFFYSQASYLFLAFAGTLPEGFIYSEYARQGFFEMLFLSLINLGIILFLQLFCAKAEHFSKIKDIASVVYCNITLLLIVIAIRKMCLYIENYSMTRMRVYTMAFMFFLGIIFILIQLWIFKSRRLKIFRYISICFVIWLLLLVYSRPDYIIARTNINMYRSGQTRVLDISSLNELSADAWGYLSDADEIPEKYKTEKYYQLIKQSNSGSNISAIVSLSRLKSYR